LARTFQSLTVRNYRLFVTGQMLKLLGSWMQVTAQDWLVLQLSDNSAQALGIVTAFQFTPVLLLTLYGGKLADRYDKRKIIIGANFFVSGLALFLGLLVATDRVTLHWIFFTAALMGVVNAIEPPVRQSFVSEMVPRELVPNALSLSAATFQTARIIGPAIAGVLIDVIGLSPVFLTNTIAYLLPTVMMLQMRTSELHRAPRAAARAARVRDGLRYVWRRNDLLMPMLLLLVIGLAGFNFTLTLPLLAKNLFHTGASQFGLLSTSIAVGALMGAFAGSGRRDRPGVFIVLGAAVGFGTLELITGLSSSFLLTAVLLIPTGFFMVYFMQATNQRMQLGTDGAFRGRVMAMFSLVFLGTAPISAPAVGWIGQHLGPQVAVWGGGLTSLVAALAALGFQLHRSGARIRIALRPLPRFYVVTPEMPAPIPPGAPEIEPALSTAPAPVS
jgi:MFS family permease